jgi:Phosphotransferase enzyme family
VTRLGAEPKPPWRAVPRAVRGQVEDLAGARVVRAVRVWGGYAPSPTFRLVLADARRLFLKGTGPGSNDHMRRALASEERVYRDLGPWLAPWAPAFHGGVRAAGWHALLLEDLGPARIPPWTPWAVRRVMAGYAAFHSRSVGRELPDWLSRERHAEFARTWARLAAEPGGLEKLAALAGARSIEAGAWIRAALPRLREAAEALARVGPPHALLHLDTRSDNLRLQPGGRLRLVDWPYACVGPPELDVVAFAQSIACEGGPDPDSALGQYAASLSLRAEAVDAAVAAVAGYFADHAWREPIPGLPRLRRVQRRQLQASLAWCARRLGLPAPAWLAELEP